MIDIVEKKDCCGCEACVQICPDKCISLSEDNEGFLYPKVKIEDCTKCGLCNSVCPVINQAKQGTPLNVYAAKNRNEEVRMKSSSGGVFTALAELIISEGGIVFGARFNEKWEVIHDYTETIEGLAPFRGSKYVQSRIGNAYLVAEDFLKQGRKVLFSGTPCQIAGLKLFLRKEYENLLTVDVICHGVPSPKVWSLYLEEISNGNCKAGENSYKYIRKPVEITNIDFRDKSTGWKKFGFVVRKKATEDDKNTVLLSETLDKNVFMKGFLRNLYLRPSCHCCPSRCFKSGSDITIGDFWGVSNYYPEFDDDSGCSVIFCNDFKGLRYFNNSQQHFVYIASDLNAAYAGNTCILNSVLPNNKRVVFFQQYSNTSLINNIDNKVLLSFQAKLENLGKFLFLRIKKQFNKIIKQH